MTEPADIAVTTILALLIIANISGNFLVCLIVRKNRDMRCVEYAKTLPFYLIRPDKSNKPVSQATQN